MKHDCSGECKHNKLKFCVKCQKAYCEECGKEWPEKEYISYPYIYPYTVPYRFDTYRYYLTSSNSVYAS